MMYPNFFYPKITRLLSISNWVPVRCVPNAKYLHQTGNQRNGNTAI